WDSAAPGAETFLRAGAGSLAPLRSPAAPLSFIDYFFYGDGASIPPSAPQAPPPPPRPAERCESPASLQAPRPPPPHLACWPALINLIHLELIVFTLAFPPQPLGGGRGRGRGGGGRGGGGRAGRGSADRLGLNLDSAISRRKCYRNTEQPCVGEEGKEAAAKEQNQLLCV
ncbi:unnamed protein product, partial [Bubo scandiacus]